MDRRTSLRTMLTLLSGAVAGGLFGGVVPGTGPTAHAAPLRTTAAGYEMQVMVGGAPARTYYHAGETYIMGQNGDRYTIRVWNHTGRRMEAVVTVDGRDVIDGRVGDYRNKRGYVVPAYGHIDIDGWRVSQGQAAAFRFSSVGNSYAARTGSAREVGVIGVAVFPERYVPPPRPLYAPPPRRPYDPYRYEDGYLGGAESRDMESRAGKAGDKAATASPPAPESSRAQGGAAGTIMPRDEYDRRAKGEGRYRPGLGTEFGEAVDSRVYETSFVRANPYSPSVVLGARYNDREGLLAMGVDVDGYRPYYDEGYTRRTADPFPVNDRGYATPPPGWDGR